MTTRRRKLNRLAAGFAIVFLALSSVSIGIAGMVSSWIGPIEVRENVPPEWSDDFPLR